MYSGIHNQSVADTASWRRLYLARAKLKASSRTSALLSGFALVAMVEVDLRNGTGVPIPGGWLIAFSICTTLVVAVHLLALMVSTCILPNVEAVCNVNSMAGVQDSPHEHMHCYIEMAWIFSTGVGILLFLIQMAILAWVRFININQTASIVATTLIVPAIIIFIAFAVHFYRQLIAHKYEQSAKVLEELQCMATELDNCHRPLQHTIQTV